MKSINLVILLILIGAFSLYAQDEESQSKSPVKDLKDSVKDLKDVNKEIDDFKVPDVQTPENKEPTPPEDKDKEKEVEEQNRQISSYLDQALKNYTDILEGEKSAEERNTDRRIKANEGLKESQQKSLKDAQNTLRDIKIYYGRRYLSLKTAYKEGKLSKDQYNKEIKKLSNEFEYKVKSLKDDVNHYQGQLSETDDTLRSLQEIQRINKIKSYNREDGKNKKGARPLSELEKFMNKVRTVDPFDLKNIFDVR